MAIQAAFRRFVEVQDAEAALAAASIKGWVASTVFVVCLVIGVAFIPGPREFFELQWQEALVAYGVMLFVIGVFHVVLRAEGGLTPRVWLLYILGNSLVLFFAASLASLSSARGGPVFATLFLFSAAHHGISHRAGPREPFLAIGAGLAALGAWALNPTPDNTSLFAVVGPTGMMVSVLAGYYGQHAARMKAETGKLRSAVQAQILSDRDRELKELRQNLVELLATNHDVNNALTALVLDAETLVALTEKPGSTSEHGEIPGRLAESLRRVLGLLDASKAAARSLGGLDSHQRTPVRPIVEQVIKAASVRHPKVKFSKTLPDTELEAWVVGGEASLHRIVENLVVNACEGDGVKAASTVRVTAELDVSGSVVRLSVADDGPGFAPELLKRAVEGFKSTKPNGTGLGLYTVGKLVRASGGTLSRRNLEDGGAQVAVELPHVEREQLEDGTSSSQAAA